MMTPLLPFPDYAQRAMDGVVVGHVIFMVVSLTYYWNFFYSAG